MTNLNFSDIDYEPVELNKKHSDATCIMFFLLGLFIGELFTITLYFVLGG